MSRRPTLADWRERALAAEEQLEQLLAAPSAPAAPVSATGPREDIASGNVWPDETDREYVEWLIQRGVDLERQLVRAEELLDRYSAWSDKALAGLDEVIARFVVEEHGPPPHRIRSSPP